MEARQGDAARSWRKACTNSRMEVVSRVGACENFHIFAKDLFWGNL